MPNLNPDDETANWIWSGHDVTPAPPARGLQQRDISDPIARIVRDHLGGLNVAAIHHTPLIHDLVSEMTDVVTRAMTEAAGETPTSAAPREDTNRDTGTDWVATTPEEAEAMIKAALAAIGERVNVRIRSGVVGKSQAVRHLLTEALYDPTLLAWAIDLKGDGDAEYHVTRATR